MSRSRSYQLIDVAKISTIVEVPNEAIARELAPLKDNPDAMREAWEEAQANGNGTPTAVVSELCI